MWRGLAEWCRCGDESCPERYLIFASSLKKQQNPSSSPTPLYYCPLLYSIGSPVRSYRFLGSMAVVVAASHITGRTGKAIVSQCHAVIGCISYKAEGGNDINKQANIRYYFLHCIVILQINCLPFCHRRRGGMKGKADIQTDSYKHTRIFPSWLLFPRSSCDDREREQTNIAFQS